MRSPVPRITALLAALSIGLPSPAIALRQEGPGDRPGLVQSLKEAGLEEPPAREVKVEKLLVDPRKPQRIEEVVTEMVFGNPESPIRRASFKYDDYGQLAQLTLDWQGEPTPVSEQIVTLEEGRTFHFSVDSDGVPRVEIEQPGEAYRWVMSGYDLLERIRDASGQLKKADRFYVTISHYVSPEGRIVPAHESFDHDEMVPFMEALLSRFGWKGSEVAVINGDLHSDDMAPPPSRLLVANANWPAFLKAQKWIGRFIWFDFAETYPSQDLQGKGVVDLKTVDLEELAEQDLLSWHVVVTADADTFSSLSWNEQNGETRDILLDRVGRWISAFRVAQGKAKIKIDAIDFTRSAFSKNNGGAYSPSE